MRILNVKKLGVSKILNQLRSQRSKNEDTSAAVIKILKDVKNNGDAAVIDYCKRFDGVELESFLVSRDEIKEAYKYVDGELVKAIKFARKNIEKFHKANLAKKDSQVETMSGVKLWREFRPIDRVGLYVPGGKAAYPSTVLMLSVPAKVAGCKDVVMCTPCDKNGQCNPVVLVTADICGIDNLYKIGGAQAIAAMAYGTETVPKVYKIFGPGNQYVTTAKVLVYGEVDIDMPAGPSELQVIADEESNVSWVAADLLSQLEHGEDSQVLLATKSEKFALNVIEEMKKQMKTLSREGIINESFKRSFAVVYEDLDDLYAITNGYAPEHLEIISNNESEILKNINNVGSVFLGEYSSEPLGDYVTGANHTLPTSGYAKMFEPLSVDSFGKKIQVQKISRKGIEKLKEPVEVLAAAEGLDGHARSVSIRFNSSLPPRGGILSKNY